MVEALSRFSYYPSFFEGSMVKQGAYTLAKRVAKPSLDLLFAISIIGLVVHQIFTRIAPFPRLLEEAVRQGNETNVAYYLGLNTRFDPALLFEAKNPQIIRLFLVCGVDKKACHKGKTLLENLFNYLTDHQLYKEGKVNQEGREMVHLMRELFEPSDLESAIAEKKWDYAAFLMFIDQREDPRPVLFRAEQPELVSALLRNGADRKAQHEEKSFLLHLFEKGRGDLAEEAWDKEYLKEDYLPNVMDIIKDCKPKKVKLQDHPKQLYRKFLIQKRAENPLLTVIVNHGVDPEKIFTVYQDIGIDRFEECLDLLKTNGEEKKAIWSVIAGQFILFKIRSQTSDWGFDEELLRFGEKGVDFHEIDGRVREPIREKILAGYPPSFLFGLFLFGKQDLLAQLVQRGYLDLERMIHRDDRNHVYRSQVPIVVHYKAFLLSLSISTGRAAAVARSASQGGGALQEGRVPLGSEERSSTR